LNVLLVTMDQFRGDCLSALGHPIAKTPNLDQLAAEGVLFSRHYSQASPCSPGRASLYTGMYQMNHRVVANGTPLDTRFDNIAKAARRAGYVPTLFGYTDQSIDPRDASGPDDARLCTYESVLPGFESGLHLTGGDPSAWMDWLRRMGHDIPDSADDALKSESQRPAEHSMSAFLADRFIEWTGRQKSPWFAHVSQLRPHPPFAAAGHFASMYDPADMPAPIDAATERHRLHDMLMRIPLFSAPVDKAELAGLQAQYFGMVSEADHQFGRICAALRRMDQWKNTFIAVISDHGEQLGDHGLIQKFGFFESSFHIPGFVRDPREGKARGRVVRAFTENIDVFPTLCDVMGVPVPTQCDGLPLTPFLDDTEPPWWRDAAHWEFDWRFLFIPYGPHAWPWDRRLERQTLSVRRDERAAYVHFGDGSFLCFDLAADPTWRTPMRDPEQVLAQAQAMLTWRAQNADRAMTGMLAERGGIGRWPQMPDGWGKPHR
jgi:arylsulfatase A-like enzyme